MAASSACELASAPSEARSSLPKWPRSASSCACDIGHFGANWRRANTALGASLVQLYPPLAWGFPLSLCVRGHMPAKFDNSACEVRKPAQPW